MSIFFWYGGDVQGDATHEGYKGWIEITDFGWEINREITTRSGSAVNREAKEPRIGNVFMSKPIDSSSARLAKEGPRDKQGRDVKISFVATDAEGQGQEYLALKLYNALISKLDIRCSADGRPTEQLRIDFTKYEQTFKFMAQDNVAASPMTIGYDIATAKMS